MTISCIKCDYELLSIWKYCPECGTLRQHAGNKTVSIQTDNAYKIPERFRILINEYQQLTGHILNDEVLKLFLEHPNIGKLSVIDSDRRYRAGNEVRKHLSDKKYSLDLDEWLDCIYDNPIPRQQNRVWITTGGAKYHSKQECSALTSGQNYAQAKGKETYKPQFVLLRDAAFVNEYKPCEICKPPKYIQ